MEATRKAHEPWSVRLLGAFELRIADRALPARALGSRKQRQVLKLLLIERERRVSAERIVDALWDEPPRNDTRQVATLVSRLRSVLGREAIAGGPDAYQVRLPEGSEVDLDEAERLTTVAERSLTQAEPGLATSAAEQALALLERGAPLEDEPYAEWVEPVREQAARLVRRARSQVWRAALATSDLAAAIEAAERAIATDPLDEEAHRTIMVAHSEAGSAAQALAAYERFGRALEAELGVAPTPKMRELRDRIAEGEGAGDHADGAGSGEGSEASGIGPGIAAPVSREVTDQVFVGRESESEALRSAWEDATAGVTRLLLLVGEAGIGKSTLARRAVDWARETGGLVLEARCYGAERSLFLQPIVDALRPLIVRSSPATLRGLVGEAATGLMRLLPELATVLDRREPPPTTPELEHRRTFEAAAHVLRELTSRQPVLMLLDDLHSAGAATDEFLHFLVRRRPPVPLLVVATVRAEEGEEALRLLGGVGEAVHVGPLPPHAVRQLAEAMGCAGVADQLFERAAGHPLFLVEVLRSLAERGEHAAEEDLASIPASLRSAVVERAERAGAGVANLLAAAAVLGRRFDLEGVAALAEMTTEDAIRSAEGAQRARLVVATEAGFAFSNDLVHEILYEASPAPVRQLRHRAAASRATQPEVVARHAHAAGDWSLAAASWYDAAARAAAAYANRDAERLLDTSLEAARHAGDLGHEARSRLLRGQMRERLARYTESFEDHATAREIARRMGAPDIEMRALQEMAGDPSVALGRTPAACVPYLEEALVIADDLGDHAAAVDVLRRLAILETNRLRGERALAYAEAAVERARGTGDDLTLAAALDARKTVAAYVGDIATLERVVAELRPLLARSDHLWVQQWMVFEASLVPFARGSWAAADRAIERALELNQRSGYHAYQPMFLAQRAWIEAARGAYGPAIDVARNASALAVRSQHPWWIGFADAVLGRVLLDVGAEREAAEALERGLAVAERDGADLYALRCLGPLAEVEAGRGNHERATALAERVEALTLPRGKAPLFLHAAHGPLGAARALRLIGEDERAQRLFLRVQAAASAASWVEPLAVAAVGLGDLARAAGRDHDARSHVLQAIELARGGRMPLVAADAYALLARLPTGSGATLRGPPDRRRRYACLAAGLYSRVRATVSDPALQRAFDARRSGPFTALDSASLVRDAPGVSE